jgi:hypothetical protein
MQHLQDELDDNGTYQATRNDLTNKMRAIAVQVVELSGTNVVMDRAEMENIRALLNELYDNLPDSDNLPRGKAGYWGDMHGRLDSALTDLRLSLDESSGGSGGGWSFG